MGLFLILVLSLGLAHFLPAVSPEPSSRQAASVMPTPALPSIPAPEAVPPRPAPPVAAPPPAAAATFEAAIPAVDPLVRVVFPANWRAKRIRRGVESASPDGEAFLWFELCRPAEYTVVQREHDQYFRRQGVVTRGEPRRAAFRHNGMQARSTEFDATWKGRPTILRYMTLDLGTAEGAMVLMSYWASPEGDLAHGAATKAILESISPP